MTPGFRDVPPRGLARLATVVSTAAFATAGGFVFGFLALAFIGVAGTELDPMVWGSGVLDRMVRHAVGLVGIGIVVFAGIGIVLLGAYWLAYTRQLAREAEADPARVASTQGRKVIDQTGPFVAIYVFAGYVILFGLGALALFVASLGVSRDEDVAREGLVVLGVALAVVASMIALLALSAKVWKPAWSDAALRVRAAWTPAHITAAAEQEGGASRDARVRHDTVDASVGGAPRRLKRIARVIARVGGIAGLIGAAAFFIGMYARQPGRGATQNSYGPFGEAAIDVLMAIAVPLTVVSIVVLGLALLTEWIEDIVVQVRLARLARAGSPAPAHDVLAAALTTPWPGWSAGVTLVTIGFGCGGAFGAAEIAAPGVLPPTLVPVLLAIGVVGVALIARSVGAEAASRNRLREAWSPGDVLQPGPLGKKVRRANRANRRRRTTRKGDPRR